VKKITSGINTDRYFAIKDAKSNLNDMIGIDISADYTITVKD
jgi:hypothetical protein